LQPIARYADSEHSVFIAFSCSSRSPYQLKIHQLRTPAATMSFINNSSVSATPKDAVMDQIRQEAAIDQARRLIEVLPLRALGNSPQYADDVMSENERTLLQEMRPDPRHFFIKEGRGLHIDVYGKIHRHTERGQSSVEPGRAADTERASYEGGGIGEILNIKDLPHFERDKVS